MSLEISYPNAWNNPQINDYLDNVIRVSLPISFAQYKERVSYYLAFRKVSEGIIEKVIKLPENVSRNKNIGCLVLLTKNQGNLIDWYGKSLKRKSLNLDPDFTTKAEKYAFYALKKALFLKENSDYLASRQNMDIESSKQAYIEFAGKRQLVPEGGIRIPNGDILAFSGFEGYVDEGICIAIGMKLGSLDLSQAKQISESGKQESLPFALSLIAEMS